MAFGTRNTSSQSAPLSATRSCLPPAVTATASGAVPMPTGIFTDRKRSTVRVPRLITATRSPFVTVT